MEEREMFAVCSSNLAKGRADIADSINWPFRREGKNWQIHRMQMQLAAGWKFAQFHC